MKEHKEQAAPERILGAANLLERQCAKRFGPLTDATRSRLKTATAAELERWGDAVLDAPTLQAIFASLDAASTTQEGYPLSTSKFEVTKNDALTNDQGKNVFRCHFWRIDNKSFRNIEKQSYSIPVQRTSFQLMHDANSAAKDRETFNLAHYYAAMCMLFGESGDCLDDWKGAFTFHFEVKVFKGLNSFRYGLNVINWCSGVELHFCKLHDRSDKSLDISVYKKPIESEFSAREMIILDNFICGLILAMKMFFKHIVIADFFKTVGSSLITFGCIDGEFFEHHHETRGEFDAEVNKFKDISAAQDDGIPWSEYDFRQEVIDVQVDL